MKNLIDKYIYIYIYTNFKERRNASKYSSFGGSSEVLGGTLE